MVNTVPSQYYGFIIIVILMIVSFLCSAWLYAKLKQTDVSQENKPTGLSCGVMVLNAISLAGIIYLVFFFDPFTTRMDQFNKFTGVKGCQGDTSSGSDLCSASEDTTVGISES